MLLSKNTPPFSSSILSRSYLPHPIFGYTVVVGDDEDLWQTVPQRALSYLGITEANGHTVIVSNTAASVLEAVEQNNPDLVITDLNYGRNEKAGGFEVVKQCYQKSIPVLMLTSERLMPLLNQIKAYGATVIPKDHFTYDDNGTQDNPNNVVGQIGRLLRINA